MPGRVDVCYCGTSRTAAEQVRSSEHPPGGRPWLPLALAIAGLAVVAVPLLREDAASLATPPPSATPVPATPTPLRTPPRVGEPPPGRRLPAPVPEPAPETPPPTPAPEEAAPEPTPESTPEPDAMEMRREEGRAELEANLRDLRRKLEDARRRLDSYRGACRSTTMAVKPSGCEGAEGEIRRLASEVREGVRAAETRARRDWVPPGTQREMLRDQGLDGASLRRLETELAEAFR